MTKEEVLEEAARRAREAMTHALNCEPPANCPSELVIIDIVAPKPEQITGTFSCCEPCRTGYCGQECGHGALNQLGMTLQAFLDKQHDGCMCLLEGQRIV